MIVSVTPETSADITALVAANFRSFGGGQTSQWNPIVNAMKDKPVQFAGGVDIKDVVEFVIPLAPLVTGERKLLERALTQLEHDRDLALRESNQSIDYRDDLITSVQSFLKANAVTLTAAPHAENKA
jgi:hypothetical protein